MVHALKEAWRVLRPEGLLIDLRPLSVDVPLFIRTDSGWKSAGMPDQSPDRVHEIASDRAMQVLVHEGKLVMVKRRYFYANNYWKNLTELKKDVEERWEDEVIVSKEIWQEARRLFKHGSGENRVRVSFRKKITVFQKQ